VVFSGLWYHNDNRFFPFFRIVAESYDPIVVFSGLWYHNDSRFFPFFRIVAESYDPIEELTNNLNGRVWKFN